MVYVGDSAADELAISRLKGVAYTFRVINEDSEIITRSYANYRLEGTYLSFLLHKHNANFLTPIFQGSDGVLSLLKYLERKMLGRTPKSLSRASSVMSIEAIGRDFVEFIPDETNFADKGMRRRTLSQGSKGLIRSRTSSQGSGASLRRKTLNASLQTRMSRDESFNS